MGAKIQIFNTFYNEVFKIILQFWRKNSKIQIFQKIKFCQNIIFGQFFDCQNNVFLRRSWLNAKCYLRNVFVRDDWAYNPAFQLKKMTPIPMQL